MSTKWDETKQAAVKEEITRRSKKLASQLGAECCLVIGFFKDPDDPEVIHLSVGGKSTYPPHVLFDRLAQMNRGSEQDEILRNRVRSRTPAKALNSRRR